MNLDKSPQDYHAHQLPQFDDHHQSQEGDLLSTPNRLPISSGMDWIKQAWVIFKARPSLWIGTTLIYLVAMMALSFVPIQQPYQ
ncbi:MAG: hypothetical protein Q3971_03775 [Moraxella sp.]|nr:hypothetical protein [Moraxella sp.]